MHSDLDYIINHVFLPPQLPHKDDTNASLSAHLIEKVIEAQRSFHDHVPEEQRSRWTSLTKMTTNLLELRDISGGLIPGKVETTLKEMVNGDVLALHIRAQNAGLIIRRSLGQYSFESFELSPTNAAVFGTKGRLRRCFPGPTMAISPDIMADVSFLEPLIDLLARLDVETPGEAIPIVSKAQSKVAEIRDTVHPRFVTEMLTGILRAVGQPAFPPRIYKHTREDVLWKDAYKPWKRSPLWLLLRVALQTSLLGNDDETLHLAYKSFMLHLMASILEGALKASLPSDKLFIMKAKISRRALKLKALGETSWLRSVEAVVGAVQQKLTERWHLLENNTDPFMTQQGWDSSRLSILQDTRLSLPRLQPYLTKVLARSAMASVSNNFVSDCGTRILQCSSNLPDLSWLIEEDSSQAILNLIDLELWVLESLHEWLSTSIEREETCTALARLINAYTRSALRAYTDMPGDISLMLFTLMDLWVALDKCALHHCPLLRDYAPEFPLSLLEPLLLPKKIQMERLMYIEQYLKTRRRDAMPECPSVFESIDTKASFSVRYFQESPHHQSLRRRIEAKAANKRSQKRSELESKVQRYRNLMAQYWRMNCEYAAKRKRGRTVYEHTSYSCQRCQLLSNANSITIDVHEWPLPKRDLEAKSVVFELDVPIVIHEWREVTYSLLVDVFSMKSSSRTGEQKMYTLDDYDGLKEFIKSPKSRLQLASESKPFVVSHYRDKKASQAPTEAEVCVNNGLIFGMYDSDRANSTREFLGRCDVRGKCSAELPDGPYRELLFTLNNTNHTSNQVIASQDKCPEALTLHEFYAFGTLRSGHRLQWRNIVREISTHTLNFSRQETYTLVTQAAWQAGPFCKGNICRDSHMDLEEKEFGKSLISTLDDTISAIEDNWQGAMAVRTFIALASRLLSFTTCDVVRETCIKFLRRARAISLRWTRELSQNLEQEHREQERTDLSMQILEMALTCYGTFDAEPRQLQSLFATDEDIAIATECSIMVHDRCPAVTDNMPVPMRALLRQNMRVACSLEIHLRNQLLGGCTGLDITIGRLWNGYKSGSSWMALEAPNERWLVKETSNEGGASAMQVHFNLLNGTLLVNGSPLTRLPSSYEIHSTFRRLFGEKILDVVPSNMIGMVFQARAEVFGHQLHFSMRDSELIIRARRDGQTYEMLPVHALDGDFPYALVHNYIHWLDIDTGFVEWRPLTSPWTPTIHRWQMCSSDHGEKFLMQDSLRLVDLHSPTAKAVSKVLSPLEDAVNVEITYDCEIELLEVHLRRLKLDFSLKKGATQLESKQFRGMTVDANQSLGTLTGLVHKIVLRGNIGSIRSVIIPHGEVSFEPKGHHTCVQIERSKRHVSYDLYQVDHQLGRLVDNGSIRSKLFKCYLHAVTSHCITDKLTGRTGTEEAVSTLASPSVRSFLRLDPTERDLLLLIAQLTPDHKYYPEHLRVMQTVNWKNLSPLSQHDSFSNYARSMFGQADMYNLLSEDSPQASSTDIRGCQSLLERAAIRNSPYQVHGFGAEKHTTEYDAAYDARDYTPNSLQECHVFQIAKQVDHWSVNLKCCPNLLEEIEGWGQTIHGCDLDDEFPLAYDTRWLKPPAEVLPSVLCTLHRKLTHSEVQRDKYRVMLFFSTLSYSQHANRQLIQALLAFATVPKLRGMDPPSYTSFELWHRYKPNRDLLLSETRTWTRDFHHLCPENALPKMPGETDADAVERREEEYEKAVERHLCDFVDVLIRQWPIQNVREPDDHDLSTYISVKQATDKANIWFDRWFRNAAFQDFITRTQCVMNDLIADDQIPATYLYSQPQYHSTPKQGHVTLDELLGRSAPRTSPAPLEIFDSWMCQPHTDRADHRKLDSLLERLSEPSSGHEKQYAMDLVKSSDSLRIHNGTNSKLAYSPKAFQPILEEHLVACKNYVDDTYHTICHFLQVESSITRRLACRSKMWPRLSQVSLLQLLSRGRINSLPNDWKVCLVEYGRAISLMQRAERLLTCIGSSQDFLNEIHNRGHQNWDPAQHPDWLLLEIENAITIRAVQAQIAREMISPSSGGNSIMQLNMGEGKSSVIVPIVAATLADGKMLVRVVVLKPLSPQMFHLLVVKLGGMLGRRIFHMPISRSVRLDERKAVHIRNLCEECMSTGGILLVQPEHLLSFELMGLEKVLSGESGLGSILTETQLWLDSNSRDILDESDEILSVRFELIYTMGTQRTIEFGPDRWIIIEHVLGILSRSVDEVLEISRHGLERGPVRPGSFPRVRILNSFAADILLKVVAGRICERGLPGVPVWNLPQFVQEALFRFLTILSVSEADLKLIERHVFIVDSMKKSSLLLRGLIAGGVLAFAFQQKRWRVNYGLDLSRTMLAVPYRAKDIPATRAEFSHPDATIVMTCLSYYYGGLSDKQLYVAFEKLLLCDDAQEEYEQRWVLDAPWLPSSSRQLTGINLRDHAQCSRVLFPALRLAKSTIDFYLSTIVFPKEMKEFTHKLSSSGWDIAREKVHPTTGFSGTNDSRYILPLSISQCDLPEQLHTNALVLDHLLKPENEFKQATEESEGGSLTAELLLRSVVRSEPPVRVILDVGAQVLEWTNYQVAHEWLSRVSASEAQAVIFFNDENDLSVLDHGGNVESLMMSPFAKQMDQCLVYLDEAHTRGTDLKLPSNYRAAVTLGPDLTKDRLVQACMRMRKLGKGQSVMFCSSKEVERKILSCNKKTPGDAIEVADVLQWSISETCINTKKSVLLWAIQGLRHQRRLVAISQSLRGEDRSISVDAANALLETEAQGLEVRYEFGGQRNEDDILLHGTQEKSLSERSPQIQAIQDKCLEFELKSFSNATLQEEQERELSPENEQERQVERPHALVPHTHTLHQDVERFIRSGVLDRSSAAFQPAFELFMKTSAAEYLEAGKWLTARLLITADFAQTVQTSSNEFLDSYLRPVHWIVTRKEDNGGINGLVLSPYEAHELLPTIRHGNSGVTLHIYSPQVSMSARLLDDLAFCAIPAVPRDWSRSPLVMQLNLFAGQLYLRSHVEYLSLCRFLGLCFRPPRGSVEVTSDGFVRVADRDIYDEEMARGCTFETSPVAFLRAVIALRRKGQGFAKSHLGRMLWGELLSEEEDFRKGGRERETCVEIG